MQINRSELVRKYGELFFDFNFAESMLFEYKGAFFDLTDYSLLQSLLTLTVDDEDYELAKIINNILAVYEVENRFKRYIHTPVIMQIELSGFCNCECIMCKHSYKKNDGAKYLSREKFRELEKYFAACRIVVINGYGEPFIHPEIEGIISVFEHYSVKLFTTTNLQKLPPNSAEQINAVFKRISVSCDGACAATYEAIRRGASFECFLKNVRLLRETCPDVQLFMSTVAMRQNIEEAVELVKLAKELGFEEIRFGRLGSNIFLDNKRDELIFYPNFASLIFRQAKEEGERLGIRVVVPIILENNKIDAKKAEQERLLLHETPFFFENEHYEALNRKYMNLVENKQFEHRLYSTDGAISCSGMCHWIGFGVYINSSGKIRPCTEIPYNRYQEKTEETSDYNCAELSEFRKRFIGGEVPQACMDCNFIMSNEVGRLKVNMEEYRRYFAERVRQADET